MGTRKTDDPPHLSINTHMAHHGTNVHEDSLDNESALPKPAQREIDRATRNGIPEDQDHHFRRRAATELPDSHQLALGTGIQIPNRQAPNVFGQFSPPLSYSPSLVDTTNPYSTSAHLYPQSSPTNLPDSPQSTAQPVVERKKHSKTMYSSLGSRNYTYEMEDVIPPLKPTSRSLSYSFGKPSRPATFVDASSYESVPDSPAKMVFILQTSIFTDNP